MIRTVLVLLTVSLSLMAEEKWSPLFDGKSTQGWDPRAKVETFKAVDGELHLWPADRNALLRDIRVRRVQAIVANAMPPAPALMVPTPTVCGGFRRSACYVCNGE